MSERMRGKVKNQHKGRYNMDYSPQYGDPYDIYEKAKKHVTDLKKEERTEKKMVKSERKS